MTRWNSGKAFLQSLLFISFPLLSCAPDQKTSSMMDREGKDGSFPSSEVGMRTVDTGTINPNSDTVRTDSHSTQPDTAADSRRDITDTLFQQPDASPYIDVRSTFDSPRDTTMIRDTSGSDLRNDSSTCQPACPPSQSCINEICVAIQNMENDGCLDTPAVNLSLQQLAVYQSVKISIMNKLAEVPASSRNADIIEGRDTMFRVFVTVGKDWVGRQLSARLTLSSGADQPTVYFSKKNIAASSTDASVTNTFNIPVPGTAVTSDTKYSLSVVECAAQSGTSENARFPSDGEVSLGARLTGGLKIKIIPIKVGTLEPDTTDTALTIYSKMMNAMYPITQADLTVGDTLTTNAPVNWTTMLDQLRAKRRTDNPAADVYYYGLVKPASTLRAYCTSTCTMGIGYVAGTSTNSAGSRVAVGTGFADKASAETMAHEIGHNHGREHAPCSPSGTLSGVDTAFPYTKGLVGVWGYDPRTQTLLDPAKNSDIMGYCSSKWISDYTYKGLTNRVALLNGVRSEFTIPSVVMRYRVLIIDESGPRWGIPFAEPGAPEGTPEEATIYDLQGRFLTKTTVYRTEIGDIQSTMVQVPEPKANWYAVEVNNAVPHPFEAPITVPIPPASSH